MEREIRSLENKIRFLEDKLLRSKKWSEQERLSADLTKLRATLSRLQWSKVRA